MKNQITFPKVVPSLILIVIAFLIGFQAAFIAQGFDFPAIRIGSTSVSTGIQDAGELSAYRWTETAKGYERLGLLNPRMSAAEVEAYRWNAMAQGFADAGLLNYHDNADDLLAYRWIETAKGYERLGLLNDGLDPGDLMAYRWQAMADAYQKMGLLNTP